jgi:hypothetical protein
MVKLEPIHRSFLLKETILGVVINAIICGVITFFMFRSKEIILLWGKDGLFFDLIPTLFFMTFCMTLGMTSATRARIQRGKAPAAPWHRSEHALLRFVPAMLVIRAVVFGVLALVILLPATTGLLMVFEAFSLTFQGMLLLKIFFGALIGFLLTPVIVLAAMADKGGIMLQQARGEAGP